MDTQIITTIVAGLLLVVAVLVTVIPVLPGSLLAVLTLLGWAWILGGPVAWWTAGIGMVVALIGWSASTVLTGHNLKKQMIPRGSILLAVLLAIVGMFLIPVLGLFVGFAVGLLLGEYLRRKNFPAALQAAASALKAMGLGMLVEFGCAALASSVWMIGVLIYFVNR
ncbi:hypothetical protein CQ018_07130 [Arthrobacter sp. MYb227]|uniref:DUF456 domain-containing protein n=1 Tax=Arthrobacter sp. MYb227 TaxID=1848601 RepID=UPI000CFBF825|nr:DUF456 domain-containing protein [Arthrobacter sp. MYb227]PQZ95093.1 hypothetical protein CQ018_07130 [Arthrobacter sp. MYb227]